MFVVFISLLWAHWLIVVISSKQKNLLLLRASAIQPEQWRELLWHTGQLSTGVHCGDVTWHDQQWRRGHWRNEHGSGGGSGNQQQFWGLPHGQCWTPPCNPDRTSFTSYCKLHSIDCVGPRSTFPSLHLCVCFLIWVVLCSLLWFGNL